jgi:hypothetical protein
MEKLLAALRIKARVQQGREPDPSAGIIDSQTVKGADMGGRDARGYDAGKKINGRKRFIITDPVSLLVTITVLAASWHDSDGAKTALLSAYMVTPIRHAGPESAPAHRQIGAHSAVHQAMPALLWTVDQPLGRDSIACSHHLLPSGSPK